MPRPPKIRASYRTDAQFILRLSEAVALDQRLTNTFRHDLCAKLESVARMLLDARQHQAVQPSGAGVSSGEESNKGE